MVDILQSLPPLDIETWNNLPLLSKICFAAAAAGLVLYIVLVIRGRLLGETRVRRRANSDPRSRVPVPLYHPASQRPGAAGGSQRATYVQPANGGLRRRHERRRQVGSYYNQSRTHLSLDKDAPLQRTVQRCGTIIATPILSGLHHQYARI